MIRSHGLSVRQACKAALLSRNVFHYQAHPRDDSSLRAKLLELATAHPTKGFGGLFKLLRRAGFTDNHKRVRRVYLALNLPLNRKRRRRTLGTGPQPKGAGLRPNACWSLDFVHDRTRGGRNLRALTVIDDHTRRALCVEVDSSLPAQRVIQALEHAIQNHGKPEMIRTDNAPEFRNRLQAWCLEQGIEHHRIEPGKPTQNALIERFNGTYRREVLDVHLFDSIPHARALTQQWLLHYNEERPHSALNDLTPMEFYHNYHKKT